MCAVLQGVTPVTEHLGTMTFVIFGSRKSVDAARVSCSGHHENNALVHHRFNPTTHLLAEIFEGVTRFRGSIVCDIRDRGFRV